MAQPDGGRLLCTVGDNPTAHVYDAASGRQVAQLRGHLDYSFAAAWHPDGNVVATGNQVGRGAAAARQGGWRGRGVRAARAVPAVLPAPRRPPPASYSRTRTCTHGIHPPTHDTHTWHTHSLSLFLFLLPSPPPQDMSTRLWDLRYPAASFALLKANIGAIRSLRFRCGPPGVRPAGRVGAAACAACCVCVCVCVCVCARAHVCSSCMS